MNTNLGFDFNVDKQNNTITIKREFAADRNLVWDAYTKSEMLDQWWAPSPWKAKTKSMDFRDGGSWIYAMQGPEGEEHWARADFQRIQPKSTFTALDAFSNSDGKINEEMPKSKWVVNFSDKGQDHTHVEFHIQYDDLAQLETTLQMGFKEGMTVAMEGLDKLLSSMKGRAK